MKTDPTEERNKSLPNKTIIVKFLGGFQDGRLDRSDSENQNESDDAIGWYLTSKGGKLYEQFRFFSDLGMRIHIYEITGREETKDKILISYSYVKTVLE